MAADRPHPRNFPGMDLYRTSGRRVSSMVRDSGYGLSSGYKTYSA